jgi:hypothetical protein
VFRVSTWARKVRSQGEAHHLREPCQGREEGWWCFLLTIDGIEDENEVAALGLDDLLQHPGQLETQLGQALASRGKAMQAESAGDFADGGLEEMSPGDTLNRVDDCVLQRGRMCMDGGSSVSKPLKQSLRDGTFPSGFDAIDNAVLTWCHARLDECQYGSEADVAGLVVKVLPSKKTH